MKKILTGAFVLTACASPLEVAERDLPLTLTDGVDFEFVYDASRGWYDLTVPFEFVNKTERAVTLVHCRNDVPRLERETANGWERLSFGLELLCFGTRHFEAGEAIRDTARFAWTSNPEAARAFRSGEMSGTYRLRWANLWADFRDYDPEDQSYGEALPEGLLISNAFEVVEIDP